jgi:hypothetical protein
MPTDDAAPLRYLVEWYMPHLDGWATAEIAQRLQRSLAATPTPVHPPELLYALEVPQDAYAFGVFTAESADAVVDACQQAGLPPDHVSSAIEVPIARTD